jgi:hypothetical protein
MRAAAKLEDGEAVVGEYRAQADGLEPAFGSGDIGAGSRTWPTATGGL